MKSATSDGEALARAAVGVAGEAARRLQLPAPMLVRVGNSAVFRCGDTALRVGRQGSDGEVAVRLSRLLAAAGVPVPAALADAADVDGWPVTIWPWVESSGAAVDGEALGQIVARLHAIDPADVRAVVAIPPWTASPAADPSSALAEIRDRSLLSVRQLKRLEAVCDERRDWHRRTEAPTVTCHGDLHLNNVVVTDDGLCVMDWDGLCVAPACWDHAMFTTLDLWDGAPGFYRAFARGYGRDYSNDRGCQDLAVLRLLAATANLVLKAQWDNRAVEQLEVRMRYWMGDPAGGPWRAV